VTIPVGMTLEVMALLEELETFGRLNDAAQSDRRAKMLNLDPETARFVQLLVLSSRRTRVLEIGTSNGYSTIWLATAMRLSGGLLTSIDREPAKIALARENLQRVQLGDVVHLIEGDAGPVVAGLAGPFDCVFFDADRISAPQQLQALLPKLHDDVLVLADNVLSHPDEVRAYVAFADDLPGFTTMTVPIGKGLHMAYRPRLPPVVEG
jgi:predicted O-methyltransferase YrrM